MTRTQAEIIYELTRLLKYATKDELGVALRDVSVEQLNNIKILTEAYLNDKK